MMAQPTDDDNNKKLVPRHRSAAAFRWTLGRRRRRLPTVRLGGKKSGGGGGSFLAGVKLRWVRAKYLCMLKRLKKCYDSVLKEMQTVKAVEEGEEESSRRRAQRQYETGYFVSAPPVGWI